MNYGDMVTAEVLEKFAASGCRVVDVSVDDSAALAAGFEDFLPVAKFAAVHGWTMLLHLGALRSTSSRLRRVAGPAGGFAGMRAPVDPDDVARFLNRLEETSIATDGDVRCPSVSPCQLQDAQSCRPAWDNGRPRPLASDRVSHLGTTTDEDVRCSSASERATDGDVRCPRVANALPRTILLSLNPEAHAQLAILSGSFVEAGMPGKVQLGPAWWWCDHREGIFDVLEKNAAYGVLSTFVGMTTDSRSLLSFVRHDYFRRLLARWVATKVADGDFPDDESALRPLCENIAYRNANLMKGE